VEYLRSLEFVPSVESLKQLPPDLVAAGAFVVITLLTLLIAWRFSRKRANDAGPGAPSAPPSAFATALAYALPQSKNEIASIQQDLKRAGHYRSSALVEYLAPRNGMVFGALLVFGALAVAADPRTNLPPTLLGAGALIAALAYALPRIILSSQAKNRVSRIEKGLPDALDMIRMCLTGGLPLRDAMQRVSGELSFSHPDVSLEFEIIRRQADANSMGKALRNFADRIDIPDARALSTLVTQTERMGTHVSAAVAEFADGMRRACRQRAEEQASKTSIKLLFPVILCLTPPMFILLAAPPVLRMRNFILEENRSGGLLDTSPTQLNRVLNEQAPAVP